MQYELYEHASQKMWYRRPWFYLFLCFVVISVCGVMLIFSSQLNKPDTDFKPGTQVTVLEGMSIKEITELLERENIVKSALYLYFVFKHSYTNASVKAGTYTFNDALSAERVADFLTHGAEPAPHVSITLPEGFRARDLKVYAPKQFQTIPDETLDTLDGQLFPDTYFFNNSDTDEYILERLKKAQQEKLAAYASEIRASGFSEEEIIILASIIEREAGDRESKHLVSGVLHNRLAADIPLQVDAVFHYVLGKTSAELTEEDLRTDAPYNTYRNKGLPPYAISNPGIEAIEAALRPTDTPYLYYLTGSNGDFYYAIDFETHKKNKTLYLK